MANDVLNEYQWETLWLISLVINYKSSLEQEQQNNKDKILKQMIIDTNSKIDIIDKKINLILESLDKLK